jgi:hypothetical protein
MAPMGVSMVGGRAGLGMAPVGCEAVLPMLHEPSVKRGNFEWAIDFHEETMHVPPNWGMIYLGPDAQATCPQFGVRSKVTMHVEGSSLQTLLWANEKSPTTVKVMGFWFTTCTAYLLLRFLTPLSC